MQNTTQEFKVGDKVKYKNANEALLNNHNPDMIYTIDEIIFNYCGYGAPAVSFHGSISKPWLSQLQLAEQPEKHIHHDLIVAWAKDPTNVIIQYRHSHGWGDVIGNSFVWDSELEYRIKPKTKEVTRWKWVFLSGRCTMMESTAYYTEEEAKNQFKNAPPYKLEHTAITATEEV